MNISNWKYEIQINIIGRVRSVNVKHVNYQNIDEIIILERDFEKWFINNVRHKKYFEKSFGNYLTYNANI